MGVDMFTYMHYNFCAMYRRMFFIIDLYKVEN